MKMKLLPAFALLLLVSTVGFAANKTSESPFLGSTSQFKKTDRDPKLLVFRHSTKKAVDFKKVIFDPVMIYQSPNSQQKQLTQDEIVALGLNFKELVEEKFKDTVEIVSAPGADVLRARFAIRGLRRGNYYMDGAGDHKIKPDSRVAAATLEMEGIDSLTGERIVALVQNIGSEQLENFEKEETLQTVQNIFTNWAETLKRIYLENKAQSTIPK